MNGTPLALQTVLPPSEREKSKKGVLARLDPLPRFEIMQPGNVLRIFERGGRFRAEIGIPETMEDPGRPIGSRLSTRGFGTENRVDPTFTGLSKTRLLDPTLNFMGTNDHPGDYRSSGCTACHVVYANDRSRVHSGPYAKYGHRGLSQNPDPTIPKNEPGHPIEHRFAKGSSIPTSQCMVCHILPGTTVMNSYEVTQRDEPQVVLGSTLQKLAFPDHFARHHAHGDKLAISHEHPGMGIGEQIFKPWLKADVQALLARGEFLYAACGDAGVRVFDIPFIDHKGFSERIAMASVSPFGQRFFLRTKHATSLAAPTAIAPDPTRKQYPANREQTIHPMYGNIYVTDKYEGLIVVGAASLLDGNPLNNFLHREVTFNPDGILRGANTISIVGTFAYIGCDAGLVVVSLADPKKPCVTAVVGAPNVKKSRSIAAQSGHSTATRCSGCICVRATCGAWTTTRDHRCIDWPSRGWQNDLSSSRACQ